jgi:hypothetical protein
MYFNSSTRPLLLKREGEKKVSRVPLFLREGLSVSSSSDIRGRRAI